VVLHTWRPSVRAAPGWCRREKWKNLLGSSSNFGGVFRLACLRDSQIRLAPPSFQAGAKSVSCRTVQAWLAGVLRAVKNTIDFIVDRIHHSLIALGSYFSTDCQQPTGLRQAKKAKIFLLLHVLRTAVFT